MTTGPSEFLHSGDRWSRATDGPSTRRRAWAARKDLTSWCATDSAKNLASDVRMAHRRRARATPRTEVHIRSIGQYYLFSPPSEPDPISGGRIWLGEEGPTKSGRGADGAGDGEPMPGMGARGIAGAAGAR